MTNLPVTPGDNAVTVALTEWLIGRDVFFEDGPPALERTMHDFGAFADQIIARHRQPHYLPGDVGAAAIKKLVYRAYCAGFNDRPGEQFWNDREADFDAALTPSALSGDAGEGEGHWLIERRCDPPQWSVEPRPTGIGAFYSDIHRAHRFASKDEASEAMRNMSVSAAERGEYFVSEHVWIEND